ncbi:MAG TPA: hypothetical protein VHN78_16860, partial [Chloroflexota bacterium]|nr:hypothetical protein [Chloroflexota bacterium]
RLGRELAPPGAPRAITLRWLAILGGLVVGYGASVGLGFLLARMGQAENLSLVPLVQFGALFLGGAVAGWWAMASRAAPSRAAPRGSGFINGVAVAVAFIVVWAIQNAIYESWLAETYGPLALPRMNMGGIILGDLLNLTAAAFGGALAERMRG